MMKQGVKLATKQSHAQELYGFVGRGRDQRCLVKVRQYDNMCVGNDW